MSAVIKNYCLTIAKRDESHIKRPLIEYKPYSDGWVKTEEDITFIIESIKGLIKSGRQPIVTIFTADQ